MTVVESVVAKDVGKLSGVRNNDFAFVRSCLKIIFTDTKHRGFQYSLCLLLSGNQVLAMPLASIPTTHDTISVPLRDCLIGSEMSKIAALLTVLSPQVP